MRNSKNRTKFNELKVAVVHDLLVEYGGAEKVFFTILELFPYADVFTSLADTSSWMYKKVSHNIKKCLIMSKYIHKIESILKPFVYTYWDNLDLSEYDLVISSSGSFSAKAVVTLPTTLSVCYCHTPPKYLYSEFSEKEKLLENFGLKNMLSELIRPADFVAAQRPDVLVANSKEVQRRIRKYYKRESKVVYPPVDVPDSPPNKRIIKDYYVYVGRLYRQKGVDLLIDAFNQSGKHLIIMGGGERLDLLKRTAKKNIEFKGVVSDDEKISILQNAKAFVFAGCDEDFGIAPVEAMAYGVPVISYKSGGLKESVIEGKTGVFFTTYNAYALNLAILQFEDMQLKSADCWKQARKFSKNVFEKQFMEIISDNF